MERVETYEREVRGAKQVRVYRQTVDVDQTVPLDCSARKEDGSERERQEPPTGKSGDVALRERLDSCMNGQAARQQADGQDDRCAQDVRGCRSGNAFADVEQVRNNEDGEDRRFGG